MKNILSGLAIFIAFPLLSQNIGKVDTLATLEIFGNSEPKFLSHSLSTDLTENKLEKLPSINLVQRSGFAPEISFRGLNAFQNQIKVDGMRIFGACTDRMDPVTSYVEGPNLFDVLNDNSGIGGNAVNNLNISLFDPSVENNNVVSGKFYGSYQNNGNQVFAGALVSAQKNKLSLTLNGNVRKADNYTSGGGVEVPFTQFQKQNFFGRLAYKNQFHEVGGLAIIDRAQNIGFAALPMDVSIANANIFKFYHSFKSTKLIVENNLYHSNIYHEMDDTKRPFVPIHMDMPGWSNTLGFNGKVEHLNEQLRVGVDYEVFRNRRIAEMTMYPPNEIEMFMYTWAPMNRKQLNITPYVAYYHKNLNFKYRVNTSLNQDEFIDSTGMGVGQLNVFGYHVDTINQHIAFSHFFEAEYSANEAFTLSYQLNAGSRIPSISELYGFYLFNSQDGFDYVGNPNMENEQFINQELNVNYNHKKGFIKFSVFNYHFDNYIFGAHDASLWQMTIGANGVKIYDNYGKANITGAELSLNQNWNEFIGSFTTVAYQYGEGEQIGNLPWISPLTIRSSNWVSYKGIKLNTHQTYGAAQKYFNANFGEDATPSYYVFDFDFSKAIEIGNSSLNTKLGVQNLFDANYFTHLDWNNIPRRGRSLFIEVMYSF